MPAAAQGPAGTTILSRPLRAMPKEIQARMDYNRPRPMAAGGGGGGGNLLESLGLGGMFGGGGGGAPPGAWGGPGGTYPQGGGASGAWMPGGPGGGGGGGGGGGTAGGQLGGLTSNVAASPQQSESYEAMKAFSEGLANKQNQQIQHALQRGRDLTAVNLSDVRGAAGARGGGPGSGLSERAQLSAAMQGARQNAATNVDLTATALDKQQAALGGQSGAANAMEAARNAAQEAATGLYNAQTGRMSAMNQVQIAQMQNQGNILGMLLNFAQNAQRFYSG